MYNDFEVLIILKLLKLNLKSYKNIFKWSLKLYKKYNSLINHYSEKDIKKFYKLFDIKNERFCVSEKIDGSNISILFIPNEKSPKVFSRNKEVTNSNFNNCDSLIDSVYNNELNFIQKQADSTNSTYRLFGELFGSNILKRIRYGELQIRFFDLMINDLMVSQKDFLYFMKDVSHKLIVPYFDLDISFEDAMNFNVDRQSAIAPDNMEGVVIKPIFNVIFSPIGSIFYIKKKSVKFQEKGRKVRVSNAKKYSETIENAKSIFSQYINENRVLSLFSKEGEISSSKEIGKYLGLVMKDAKEDFFKEIITENELSETVSSKNEEKYIFDCNKEILDILKKYL